MAADGVGSSVSLQLPQAPQPLPAGSHAINRLSIGSRERQEGERKRERGSSLFVVAVVSKRIAIDKSPSIIFSLVQIFSLKCSDAAQMSSVQFSSVQFSSVEMR